MQALTIDYPLKKFWQRLKIINPTEARVALDRQKGLRTADLLLFKGQRGKLEVARWRHGEWESFGSRRLHDFGADLNWTNHDLDDV